MCPISRSAYTMTCCSLQTCDMLHTLNEQVVYKRGVAGAKKMATGINYCQNGRLAKAKVTLVFWTQALSHD